jgi:hypothetical protein
MGTPHWPVSTVQCSHWALCLVFCWVSPTTRGRRGYYTTDKRRMQGSQCRQCRKREGFNTLTRISQNRYRPPEATVCETSRPERSKLRRRQGQARSGMRLRYAEAEVPFLDHRKVSPPFLWKGGEKGCDSPRRAVEHYAIQWRLVLHKPPRRVSRTVQQCRKRPS